MRLSYSGKSLFPMSPSNKILSTWPPRANPVIHINPTKPVAPKRLVFLIATSKNLPNIWRIQVKNNDLKLNKSQAFLHKMEWQQYVVLKSYNIMPCANLQSDWLLITVIIWVCPYISGNAVNCAAPEITANENATAVNTSSPGSAAKTPNTMP